MLLDYLAAYRHCSQKQGWSLPAHSWWTDQARPAGWRGPGLLATRQRSLSPPPPVHITPTLARLPRMQTMGGAVATSTHGSSLKYGSLSSQLLALDLIAANGSLLALAHDTRPHLFKAAAASVGRLGVVTRLTFRIKPQLAVTKSLQVGGVCDAGGRCLGWAATSQGRPVGPLALPGCLLACLPVSSRAPAPQPPCHPALALPRPPAPPPDRS